MNEIYNFSAGPAMLPKEVLIKAQKDFCNWKNHGFSIMEISHRSKYFEEIVKEIKSDMKELLRIPDNYEIIFCHGGARGQFSSIPMNLLKKNDQADYIDSGYWSSLAAIEALKYCNPNIINVKNTINNKKSILLMKKWNISQNSSYIHYCPNETISGIAIHEPPIFRNKIIICDFSSCILSTVIDIKKYSLIYASSQKNIGPAGMTIIIVQKKLIKDIQSTLSPSILNYSILKKHNSMFNTPVTFSWYLSSLVFKWIKKIGGINSIELINKEKSAKLYSAIDDSKLYINNVNPTNRSITNVVFHLKNVSLEKEFLQESEKFGLFFLKNHYIEGGIRASIYNAMPIQGVNKLIKFMKIFEKRYT